MGQTTRIRSELPANREAQPAYRRRLRQEPFGVYRPLTEESATELKEALKTVRPKLDRYTWWKNGERFKVQATLGVTIISRRAILHAMREGALERNFDPTKAERRIMGNVPDAEEQLTIPLGGLAWYAVGGRKLVSRLGQCEDMGTLLEQAETVYDLLDEDGAALNPEKIYEPDHVTLFRYGSSRDFSTPGRQRHNRLSEGQRADLAGMVQDRLETAGIGEVTLGALMTGDGYGQQRLPLAG